MASVHMIVGVLVVLGYLALTVVSFLGWRGRPIAWARQLSFAAAAALLIQYVLGFSLLGNGHHNKAIHYVLALAAIITVGLEHGYARNLPDPENRARATTIAVALTTVLVIAAYAVGQSGAS